MLRAISTQRRMRDVVSRATGAPSATSAPYSQEEHARQIRNETAAIQARLDEATLKNEAITREIAYLSTIQAETEQQLSIARESAADADKLRAEISMLSQESASNRAVIEEKEKQMKVLRDACTQAMKKTKEHVVSSNRDIRAIRGLLKDKQDAIKQEIGDISKAAGLIRSLETDRSDKAAKSNKEHADRVQELKGQLNELQQTYLVIETQNKELQIQMTKITKRAAEQEKENESLQSELRELQEELKNEKRALSAKNGELADCTEAKTYIEGQLESKNVEVGKLKVSIKKKENELVSTKLEIAGIETRLSSAMRDVASLRARLELQQSTETHKLDAMRKQISEKVTEESELREQLEKITNLKHKCDDSLKQMKLEMNELQDKVSELTAELNKSRDTQRVIEASLKDKDTEVQSVKSYLRKCKESETQLLKNLQQAQGQKSRLEEEVNKTKQAIKTLKSQVDIQTNETARLKADGAGKDTELKAMSQRIEIASLELDATKKKMSDQTTELGNLNGTIKELMKKLASEQIRIKELELQLAESESRAKQTRELLAECSTKSRQHEIKIRELEAQLNRVQLVAEEQAEISNRKVSDLEDQLKKESENSQILTKQLSQKEKDLESATGDIAKLNEAKKRLQESIAKTSGDSSKLQRELGDVNSKIQNLSTQRELLSRGLRSLKGNIQNSKSSQASMASILKKIQDKNKADADNHAKKINELQAELKIAQEARAALEREKMDIKEKVEQHSSVLRDIQGALECQEGDIAECVKDRMTLLSTTQDELEKSKSIVSRMANVLGIEHDDPAATDTQTEVFTKVQVIKDENFRQKVLINALADEAGCEIDDQAGDCIKRSLTVSKSMMMKILPHSKPGPIRTQQDELAILDKLKEMAEKAASADETQAENETLKTQQLTYEDTIKSTKAELSKCTDAMSEMIKQHDNDSSLMQKNIGTLNANAETLRRTIIDLNHLIQANEDSINAKDAKIRELVGTIDVSMKKTKDAESRNNELLEKNSELAEAAANLQDALDVMKQRKDAESAELTDLQDTRKQLEELKADAEDKRQRCLYHLSMLEIPIVDKYINIAIWEEARLLVSQYNATTKTSQDQELKAVFRAIKDSALEYIDAGLKDARGISQGTSSTRKTRPVLSANQKTLLVSTIRRNLIEKAQKNPEPGNPVHTIALSMTRITESIGELVNAMSSRMIYVPDGRRIVHATSEITKAAIRSMSNSVVSIINRAIEACTSDEPINTSIDSINWGVQ